MSKTPFTPTPQSCPSGSLAGSVLGWMQGYFRFTVDFWSQSLEVAGTAAARGVRDAGNDLQQGNGAGAIVMGLLRNYVAGLADLAITASNAAEAAAMNRPAARQQVYQIGNKPFPVPAIVRDASQGWAIYFVDAAAAASELGQAATDFQLLDVGAGRTPLVILGVDYRDSDFGQYPELVVALFVQPKSQNAAMPMVHYLAIVVSQAFTKDAAKIVWGIEKTLRPTCSAIYATDYVRFQVAPGALAITYPRFGTASSAAIPIHSVSFQNKLAMQAVSMRAGSGEGSQIGGSVRLMLGDPKVGNCLCAGEAEKCFCDTLRKFDIASFLPAANGWTEKMTGDFGPPSPMKLPKPPISRSEITG